MPENTTASPRQEAGRTRSPNYPSIPLPEAINRAKQIYEKEHTHKASAEVVAKSMGYTGLNGTSRTTTSALKKYGLLQSEGDGLKITSDAVDILELPLHDPLSVQARTRAAFRPPLFAEFKETYGNKLPSDDNLRHSLIKKGFHPRMAGDVIQIYKDTIASLGDDWDAKPTSASAAATPAEQQGLFDAPSGAQDVAPTVAPPAAPAPQNWALDEGPGTESLQYRVSASSRARVVFEGAVTREAIEKLIAYLTLSLDDYPSSKSLQPKIRATVTPPVEAPIVVAPSVTATGIVPTQDAVFSKTGPALWRAPEADQEVNVAGYIGERAGRHYFAVEGSNAGIPVDEVEFFDDSDFE